MRIKEKPKDFIVVEEMDLKLSNGKYNYFILEKKNWNTVDAIKEIALRLGIKERDIGFAGNKDRKALTKQHISIFNVDAKRVLNLKIKDLKLEYAGNGKDRICLGDLNGNRFKIIVKDCKGFRKKEVINYFGEQRFGRNNVEIGRSIIEKDFKKVCELLGLKAERNDYIGAMKRLGLRKLKIYISAYQGYLWNELAGRSKKKIIPIIGYLYKGKEYNVKSSDFLLRQIPELSAEGGERERFVRIKDFKATKLKKDVYEVEFWLPKGCYATEVLRQLAL